MKRRIGQWVWALLELIGRLLAALDRITSPYRWRLARWLEPRTRGLRYRLRPYLERFKDFQDRTEYRLPQKYPRIAAFIRRRFFYPWIISFRATPAYQRHDRAYRLGAWFVAFYPFLYFLFILITLPSVEMLDNPEYALPTSVYDRNGKLVKEIYVKRRKLVTYDKFPPYLIKALVAKEDSDFYHHLGIDPLRILKAAYVNISHFRVVQGASTLTQQTAKQFFLSHERTLSRKFRELILALMIEAKYSKDEILTLYLNKVNLGDAWGIEAAAQVYFNKSTEDLTLNEAAVLVGMLPAPNVYKPTRNPHLARRQRDVVLKRMVAEGYLTEEAMAKVMAEPIVVVREAVLDEEAGAYYVELVRRELQTRYGSKQLYEGGLKVITAMNLDYQRKAHQAFAQGLVELDQRRGYRGSSNKVEPDENGQIPLSDLVDLNPPGSLVSGYVGKGVVTAVGNDQVSVYMGYGGEGVIPWAPQVDLWHIARDPKNPDRVFSMANPRAVLAKGDLIMVKVREKDEQGQIRLDLYQEPDVNGALYSIDPRTGEVLAMVGGYRFGRGRGASEYIRATQALRQPGSSFKPIVYATALDEGFTPATVLDDSPRVFKLAGGKKHIPKNYDDTYKGAMTLREALYQSRNVPTVQVVDEVGPAKVIDYARRLGITSAIPEENIIGLGTHSVRLSELVHAYGPFAAKGVLAKPLYILRVEDNQGHVLEENIPQTSQAISETTAFLLADIMQDVVRQPGGTAHRVLDGFGRPVGAKTGTTQNSTDAWFVGFIPQMVTGVYVGFDDPSRPLGPWETGARAAAPIWRNYMDAVKQKLPVEGFTQPAGVVSHRVDEAGNLLSGCEGGQGGHMEFFKESSIPASKGGGDCYRPTLSGSRKGGKKNGESALPEDTGL